MPSNLKANMDTFFDWASYFGAALAIILFPFFIAHTNVALGICIFFYLLKKIVGSRWDVSSSAISIFLPLFFIYSIFSVFNSINLKASTEGLQKLIKYFFLILAFMETARNEIRLKGLAWCIVISALLVSLDGVMQFTNGRDWVRGFPSMISAPLDGAGANFIRLTASFHNPQSFALFLIVAIPLLVSLLRYAGYSIGKRLLIFLTSALSVFCFMFTYSRGCAIAFLSVTFFFIVLKRDKIIALALLLIFLFALIFFASSPLQWVASRPSPVGLLYDSSRLLHWKTAINMIKSHPFIGVGINTFVGNYEKYKSSGDTFVNWYAHNAFLQLAAEVGLVGFAFFAGMIFFASRTWWRSYCRESSTELKAISLGLFGGLLGLIVSGFWESFLQYSNPAVSFWIILALVMCVSSLRRADAS
jgi:O-antigen ligase